MMEFSYFNMIPIIVMYGAFILMNCFFSYDEEPSKAGPLRVPTPIR
jgi:hypothetical protein